MSATLLLIDDSGTMHRVVELTFAGQDIRVVPVHDGQQAIERLAAQPVDIVLADVAAPRVNGYEVAAFLRRQPALAHVPVLLLAGAFDTVDEQRVRESGASGVLVKPFEPAVVIRRVKELLGLGKNEQPPAPPAGHRMITPEPSSPEVESARHAEGDRNPPAAAPESTTPMPPARASEPQTLQPVSWNELREQTGLAPDTAHVEGQSSSDDYFARLDAAFDSLDAQIAGRPPARPARNAPTSVADQLAAAPAAAANAEAPPAYEVSSDLFARKSHEAPAPAEALYTDAAPAAAAPTEPAAAGVTEPVVSATAPAPTPSAPVSAAAVASPRVEPVAAPATAASAPASPVVPVAPDNPAEPENRTAPAAPAAPVAPVAPARMADAFDALFAAEQGAPAPAPQLVDLSDETIERIAVRVAERLAQRLFDDAMTRVVTAVTERLVREEIARIRAAAQSKTS